MKKSNRLLEQAKQGNVKVIAALMNRQLKAQGMMADIQRHDDRLEILIESDRPSLTADYKVPNQGALVAMIEKWLLALEVTPIAKAKVSWQLSGQVQPAWSEEFWLNPDLQDDRDQLDQATTQDYPLQQQASYQAETEPLKGIAAIDVPDTNSRKPASPDYDNDDAALAADLEEIPHLEQFPIAEPVSMSSLDDRQAHLADYVADQDYDTDDLAEQPDDLSDPYELSQSTHKTDFASTDRRASTPGNPNLAMQLVQFVALSVIVVLVMMGLNQLFGKSTSNSTKQSDRHQLNPVTSKVAQIEAAVLNKI
jgi:hypothetical protein